MTRVRRRLICLTVVFSATENSLLLKMNPVLSQHRAAVFFITTVLSIAAVILPSGALGQTRELSDTGMLLDGVAAIVNDGVVLKSELESETRKIIERLRASGTQVPPANQLLPQVLERLVIQRVQLQRAERVGLRVPDEALNQALASIAQRNNVSLTELPEALAQQGIEYSAYRSELRNQLTVEQLRQRDVLARISVTPRELDDYMQREAGRASSNQEFNLSQILVATSADASAADIETAQARADSLYERLLAGEAFDQVAIANSDGQRALEGGDLGWRRGDELPTIFADIVPGLQIGQVSEPVRSGSGFHIVRVDDKRGGEPVMEDQVLARHILITTNEVLDDPAVRQKLLEIRGQILAGDEFAAVAKAVSEDPGSAVEGGELGWTDPAIFAPEFRSVVETAPIGELSEPFKSPFGWHIVEVLDRRTEDMTEELARQKAIDAIRSSKVGEESELWARRLRDQAFVDYRL